MKLKPDYIPFIHNYCDRWCEKCPFTSRCNAYEATTEISLETQDLNNKAFWENMGMHLKEAREMLLQMASEKAIDLTEMSSVDQHRKSIENKTKKHPLATISLSYAREVSTWMGQENWKTKSSDIIHLMKMGIIPADQATKQFISLKDCLDVVNWYTHFIHVKLVRALSSEINEMEWGDDNGNEKDSDGSAKIALIAIERSIQSLAMVLQFLPDLEDFILTQLSNLQKLKELTGQEFPNAISFKRPGFDD